MNLSFFPGRMRRKFNFLKVRLFCWSWTHIQLFVKMSKKLNFQNLLPATATQYTKSEFVFQQKLGSGAFGQVWKARHKLTQVQFAIKQIPKQRILRLLDQIKREITIMYQLNHPYIVRLISHFEDEKYLYMVLELIEGGTLFYKLTQENVLLERVACQYFREIVEAVEFLHSRDPVIIHRDIKPENIMLQKTGEVKLTDFGWANFISAHTERMTACGTLEYLPPEMVTDKGHDTCADIWCLGILLYEMLAGITPFKGSGREKTLANITKGTLKFPRGFPALAKDLVVKMLEKNKEKRISIFQIKEHRWLQITQPLREPLKIPQNKTQISECNNETENSYSENEFDDDVSKVPVNTYRKSILYLKNNIERKSNQVSSQRSSLVNLLKELPGLKGKLKSLEEKIENKKNELVQMTGKNKELLAKCFDLNLELEKLTDLNEAFVSDSRTDAMLRHIELKKLVNLHKIILDNQKIEYKNATQTFNEAEQQLKHFQFKMKEMKTLDLQSKSKQSSSIYELKLNLDSLKTQLTEKKNVSHSEVVDQIYYKEISSFIREKITDFPNKHRELARKLEEMEDQANEKEQQISELTIEYEMKKSQKLYNLRKKKDEFLRKTRKDKDQTDNIKKKLSADKIELIKKELDDSRRIVNYVDETELDGCKKRIEVRII